MSTSPGLALASVLRLTWWKLAIAVAAGVLTAQCFPPADLGPLAWVALVPLLFVLTQVRPRGGFVLGLAFGFAFMGLYGGFMLRYGLIPWFASGVFEALFFGLFGLVAAACNRAWHPAVRVLGVAGTWTLAEMLRGGIGGLGFTIGDLGYTQHDNLPLLQIASMVGHYGLAPFIVGINAALTQTLLAVAPRVWARPNVHPRQFAQLAARTALSAYVVVLLLYLWGALIIRQDAGPSGEMLEAAVVQGALGDSEGATRTDAEHALETYAALTETIPEPVDLIVWPEVAVPEALNRRADMRERIGAIARDKSAWMIVGGFEFSPEGKVFNTLYVFSPSGTHTQVYRKVILVPFGESVPMRDRFPWLARFSLRSVDYTPGERHLTLDLGQHKAGPLICFEGLFPHATRANVRLGAEFIVLATSDAWAAGTHEIEQHSAVAPLRAVESRRWVVRAGTWGISQIISPWGRVVASVPSSQPGAAWAQIEPRSELSVYHYYGDLPMLIVCSLAVLAALMGLPRLASRAAGASEPPATG